MLFAQCALHRNVFFALTGYVSCPQCVFDFTSLRFCYNITTKYNPVLNQSAVIADDSRSTGDVTPGSGDVTSSGGRNSSAIGCLPASQSHFPEVSGACAVHSSCTRLCTQLRQLTACRA